MKILWIKTELLHPVDKGGRIRTYQMLRALRKHHEVTYLCLHERAEIHEAIQKADEYCTNLVTVDFKPPAKGSFGYLIALLKNAFSRLPYAVGRYQSVALSRRILDLAPEHDLVVCDFLAPSCNVSDGVAAKAVLFQHNVEAMIWERHASVPQSRIRKAFMCLQWQRMRRFEAAECRRFARVIAVSEVDAAVMRRDYGVASAAAIATGVDTDYFTPPQRFERQSSNMVFVGSMDWVPNEDGMRWFMTDVLPRIRKVVPDATLTIVGRSPSSEMFALAERVGGVKVTGTVPDVRPYMHRAALSIVPLRIGGGTRLKIFESMAAGLPVVSTSIGAEGLSVESGVHFARADTPEDLSSEICTLLRDRTRASRMADAALAYVRQNCSWDAVSEEFIAISCA